MRHWLLLFLALSSAVWARDLGGGLGMIDMGCHPWEAVNRRQPEGRLPWYFEELDPDVRNALCELGLRGAHLLDIGSGPGTQAIALAGEGFVVTGMDISPTAIERARKLSCSVEFVEDNILAPHLSEQFAVLVDRGCLHVLDPDEWESYRAGVSQLLEPGGYLLLKTFSSREPMTGGPRRFSLSEICEVFGGEYELVNAKETVYHGLVEPSPRALFCVLRRR